MIVITEHKGHITIEGHAEYAPRGSDIVCAGVSAVTEGFILSLEKLTANRPIYEIENGYAMIKTGEAMGYVKLLCDSFFISCENIAQQFPDHVRVCRLDTH